MSADGSTCDWQPLNAPLNPAFIHPFDTLHIQAKGCHIGWDGYLQGWGDSQGEASCANLPPSAAGSEGLGSIPSDSWEGSLENSGSKDLAMSFRWGEAEDMGDCDMAPLKSLYKPSASDPATANCNFRSASVSSLCASSLSPLALLNKWSPWKRKKKGICHKGQA